MNAFRAIVRKDVWQNRPWAALAMLATAGALVYAIHDFRVDEYHTYGTPMGTQFMMVSKMASAFCGALLGLLVVAFDARGDAWAFLVHRPVPRTTIFWGKLLAAWALYVFAAGMPLAGAIAWLLMPGHVAMPYSLETALPTIADFIAGGVCVPLGMIVGQSPARWYASRGLPLGAMFLVMASTFAAFEFWHSILMSAVFGAIAVTAARGVFVTGASGTRITGPACAALSLIVFVGLFLVGSILSIVFNALTFSGGQRWRMLEFAADGRVVISESNADQFSVTSVDGTPAPDLEKFRDAQEFWRSRPPTALLSNFDSAEVRRTPYWMGNREFIVLTLLDGNAIWYFMPGTGRIAGYSQASRRYIGSVGPRGFAAPGESPEDGFSGGLVGFRFFSYDEQKRIVFPAAVYKFDLTTRTVNLVFTPPKGTTIRAYMGWVDGKNDGANEGNFRLCLLTDDRVINLDPQGKVVQSIVLPAEVRGSGKPQTISLMHFANPDRYALATTEAYPSSKLRVYELDAEGTPGPARVYGPIDQRETASPLDRWIGVVMAGAVGPSLMGFVVFVSWYVSGKVQLTEPGSSELTNYAAATVVSMLLGMAICLWLARRWRLPRAATIGWSIGGAVIGVLAPLVMLCVEERPVFERCPTCGKQRAAASVLCEHCNAPATVAADGSEVFAPLTGATQPPV